MNERTIWYMSIPVVHTKKKKPPNTNRFETEIGNASGQKEVINNHNKRL